MTAQDASAGQVIDGQSEEGILYHITHDVRACLRAIKTIPEWVQDDLAGEGIDLPDPTRELFDMLAVQVARADRLLLDLRDYDRIGRMSDPMSWNEIDDLIKAGRQLAEMPVDFTLEADLPAPRVFGSRNDLQSLFAALISNAVRHHDKGHGTIRIVSRQSPDGVLLRVRDDGPGIPAEFHEKVFDLLSTLKSRDDCDTSGVGLAKARRILARTGGSIHVVDRPGRGGTTFELFFPNPQG